MTGLPAERLAELRMLAAQHVVLVTAATAAAVVLGVPLGLLLTRRPRAARVALAAAGVVQTIPSLALFGFLIPLPFVGGIGARTAIVALVVYALLPILRNTYVGVRQLDPAIVEAATAMGMTDRQRLRLVEIPLALPVILAGVRIAAVVSVGTATIAAAIGAGGLGTYVFRGLATLDTGLVLLGAIPAALLALLADGLLARVERSARPARAAAILAAGAVVILALGAGRAAVRGGGDRPVVVVSKNFTEQVILGEVLAATIERAGLPVDRRLNLGGTHLCHEALRAGRADAYVEYTGTALKDVLKEPTRTDPREVLRIVRERYAAMGLFVGEPLGFDNTFALVMTRAGSERRGIRRISDLAAHPDVRVGLFGEFLEREDGMPGLAKAYGLRFTTPPREMDLGLLYRALLDGQVDLVVGSATDGLIAAHDLVVLEDDRRYFPPYDAVVVARAAALAERPALAAALRSLEGRISADVMRRMNLAVDGEKRAPADVISLLPR